MGLSIQGQFLKVSYTWSLESEPQAGIFLVRLDCEGREVESRLAGFLAYAREISWSAGEASQPDGCAMVEGAYAAPPGPDWGWRIALEHGDDDSFILRMDNIPPGGKPEQAVETKYPGGEPELAVETEYQRV